jgi:histidine triad (HIT) family protein
MEQDQNCIFCKIIAGEVPCNKIYEDELTFAFLDLNPVNTGHTLILPKNHEDHLWDLDNKIYHYLFDVAKKIKDALNLTYSPPRVGIIVEGFGVAHVHLHIVPLYKGNDLKKPQPAADPEKLEHEAKKIRTNI